MWARGTAGDWEQGARPLGPVAQPVLELLEGIAARRETESRETWYAAAVLARSIRWDFGAGTAHWTGRARVIPGSP